MRLEYRRQSPTATTRYLKAFLLTMPEPQEIYQFQSSADESYNEVVGPWPPFYLIPSGPPVYIFDEAGVLVDWTSDVGDDPDFSRTWGKWGDPSSRRPLTKDQAMAITESRP